MYTVTVEPFTAPVEFILFLYNINSFLENTTEVLLVRALQPELEKVPEAVSIYPTLIEIPDDKTYHTEHRILVTLNGEHNTSPELNHIGISMHCCALCYKIINLLGNDISITGTHGNFCKGVF